MTGQPVSRRRRSGGIAAWLPSLLLAFVLALGGIYLVWGEEPLRKMWANLGFGPKSTHLTQGEEPRPHQRTASGKGRRQNRPVVRGVSPQNVDNPTVQTAGELVGTRTEEHSYLPEPRHPHRSRAGINPAVSSRTPGRRDPAQELDSRFELEPVKTFRDSIRTADFNDPEEMLPPEPNVPKRSRIQLESADEDDFNSFSIQQLGQKVVKQDGRDEMSGSTDSAAAKARTRSNSVLRTKASGRQVSDSREPQESDVVVAFDVQHVNQLIEDGKDVEAYEILSDAYFQLPQQRALFQQQLDGAAQRIYFSPQPHVIPAYEIQPNDQLRKIAAKYQMTWQYLSRLNRVDAKKIRPGKKLKVFQGPFNATVDLSDFELVILLDGCYVKRYQVGVGKDNSSPLGVFTVREKLENPKYYGPEGNVIDPDDPANPLGERWIDIGNSFGIHGTINPDSIGKNASAGCIRMRNEDVAEVYDFLSIGSTVQIQR